jgi:ribosome-binding factor A
MHAKGGPTRKVRLESLLHHEIATCVQQLRDPRLGFVTITRVELSGDLHLCTAYWSVLGDQAQRRLTAHALEAARTLVQSTYAPVVKTRLLPQLRFAPDEVERTRGDLDELIRRARASDPDHGTRPEPPVAPTPQA